MQPWLPLSVVLVSFSPAAPSSLAKLPEVSGNDVYRARDGGVILPESSVSDFVLDLALTELRDYLKSQNQSWVKLPDLHESLVFGMVWFFASKGRFRNPETVERKGESEMKRVPGEDVVEFTFGLTFREMSVDYSSYTMVAFGVPINGEVMLRIPGNEVDLNINVALLPKCLITVRSVYVKELSGIQVNITGLGILDPLTGDLISYVLSTYRSSISEQIKDVVTAELQKELVHTSICKAVSSSSVDPKKPPHYDVHLIH